MTTREFLKQELGSWYHTYSEKEIMKFISIMDKYYNYRQSKVKNLNEKTETKPQTCSKCVNGECQGWSECFY